MADSLLGPIDSDPHPPASRPAGTFPGELNPNDPRDAELLALKAKYEARQTLPPSRAEALAAIAAAKAAATPQRRERDPDLNINVELARAATPKPFDPSLHEA